MNITKELLSLQREYEIKCEKLKQLILTDYPEPIKLERFRFLCHDIDRTFQEIVKIQAKTKNNS